MPTAHTPESTEDHSRVEQERPIPLLKGLCSDDQVWEKIAPRYGVTNPDPPWKISLYATLECLNAGAILPSLERRHIEDHLGETIYQKIPGPEQQLLSLAHILLARGLLTEEELGDRLSSVRKRLEPST
jgi:hypothetical protein